MTKMRNQPLWFSWGKGKVIEREKCKCDPKTLSYSEHFHNVCRSCLGYIKGDEEE